MRALTVRQPWAWAIVHGGKTVENRSRNLAGGYRGPVAIHAGLTFEKDTLAGEIHRAAHGTEVDTQLVFGALIGVVDLVDVHISQPEQQADCVSHGCTLHQDLPGLAKAACCTSPWAQFPSVEVRRLGDPEPELISTGVHLALANPWPLRTPVPAKGRLGLWTPDADLAASIAAAMTTTTPTPGGTE